MRPDIVIKARWHPCGAEACETLRGEAVGKHGAAKADTETLPPACLEGPGVPGTPEGMDMLLPLRRLGGPGVPGATHLIAPSLGADRQAGQKL